MATHRFETVLEAEGSGVFFEVPLDVPEVFGKARAPVRGTINGQPFRSTVAVYGGRSYLPVNKALREAAGVAAGDAVVIELEAGRPAPHRRPAARPGRRPGRRPRGPGRLRRPLLHPPA